LKNKIKEWNRNQRRSSFGKKKKKWYC